MLCSTSVLRFAGAFSAFTCVLNAQVLSMSDMISSKKVSLTVFESKKKNEFRVSQGSPGFLQAALRPASEFLTLLEPPGPVRVDPKY